MTQTAETFRINARGGFVLDPFDWSGISPRDILMKKMATVPLKLIPGAQWNLTLSIAISKGLQELTLREMKQLPLQVWLAIKTMNQPWFNLCQDLLARGRLGALDYIETFHYCPLIEMTFREDSREHLKSVTDEIKKKEQWPMLLYLQHRIQTVHTDLLLSQDDISNHIQRAIPDAPTAIQALHVYCARHDPDVKDWPDDPPPTLRITSNGKLHW